MRGELCGPRGAAEKFPFYQCALCASGILSSAKYGVEPKAASTFVTYGMRAAKGSFRRTNFFADR